MSFIPDKKIMICGLCGFKFSSDIDSAGKIVENDFSKSNLGLGKKFELSQISN
jgi:hypothetical protein